MLVPILIFSLLFIIFITLAVFGLVEKDNPKSGMMVIIGFIGLAILVIPMWSGITGELKNAGIIDYELYLILKLNSTSLLLWLPTLILLALGFIGLLSRRPDSPSFRKFGFFGAAFIFIFTAFIASGGKAVDKTNEGVTKSDTHSIQIGLEKYEAVKGLYPENIDALVSAGFMEKFPLNYYIIQPMKNVPYASPGCYGNFTYIPLTAGNEVRGYYLIAYGYKDREGAHLVSPDINDHVILVLDSNLENHSIWPSDVPFPDIKDVLEAASK
jgi:hypothetical protein